jgi:hypothetical protein
MQNERFEIIAHSLEKEDGVVRRKMFGWDCLFVNGNSFLGGSDRGMLFKLSAEDLLQAIAVPGIGRFDPMGNGKGMTGWVMAEMFSDSAWPRLAQQAFNEALSLPPKDKKGGKKPTAKAVVKKAEMPKAKKSAPVKASPKAAPKAAKKAAPKKVTKGTKRK